MQIIRKIFAVSYSAIIVLFICCGLALIFFAALELWHGLNPSEALPLRSRFNFIVEGIGLLTIAVVALELGQTILEEEVQRKVPQPPLRSVRGSWNEQKSDKSRLDSLNTFA